MNETDTNGAILVDYSDLFRFIVDCGDNPHDAAVQLLAAEACPADVRTRLRMEPAHRDLFRDRFGRAWTWADLHPLGNHTWAIVGGEVPK